MHVALQDLNLDYLFIIFPGDKRFPMHEKITACGLQLISELSELIKKI